MFLSYVLQMHLVVLSGKAMIYPVAVANDQRFVGCVAARLPCLPN